MEINTVDVRQIRSEENLTKEKVDERHISSEENLTKKTVDERQTSSEENLTKEIVDERQISSEENLTEDTIHERQINSEENLIKDTVDERQINSEENLIKDTVDERQINSEENLVKDMVDEKQISSEENLTKETVHERQINSEENLTKDTTDERQISSEENLTKDTIHERQISSEENLTEDTIHERQISSEENLTKDTVDERQISSEENLTKDSYLKSINMKTSEKKGIINLTAKRSPWSSLIMKNVKEEGFKQDRDNQSGPEYEKLHIPVNLGDKKVESVDDEEGKIDACFSHFSSNNLDLNFTMRMLDISSQSLKENSVNQKFEVAWSQENPPVQNERSLLPERTSSPSGALEQKMQFSLPDVKAEATQIEVPQTSTGVSLQTRTLPEVQQIIGGYSPNQTIPQPGMDTEVPGTGMPQPVVGVSLKNGNASPMASMEVNSSFIIEQVKSSISPWQQNAYIMPGQLNSSGGTTRPMVLPGYTGSYAYYPWQAMPVIPPGGHPMSYSPYPTGPYGTKHPAPSPAVQHNPTASSHPVYHPPSQASLMYMRSPMYYQTNKGGSIGHEGLRDTAGQWLAVPRMGQMEEIGGHVDMQAAIEEVEKKCLRSEKEDEFPRMLRVKGFTRSVSHETLEMFFENTKRCGGGEIESIEFGRSRKEVFITFKDPTVVQSVLEKQKRERFSLEKMELTVEEYVPSPPDPLRLFLTNLSPRVTHECLLLYLEPCSNSAVVEVLDGRSSGTALVTFSEPPDIDWLLKRVKEKPLEGNYIQVKRVPVTRSVQLMGLHPTTTNDTVELYFENAKRSGGGPVEYVRFGRDKQSCVVFFENAKDAERVCKRPHTIDNKHIKVNLYYECLDDDLDSEEFSDLTRGILDAVELKDFNHQILRFLVKNERHRQKFEKNLSDLYGVAKWPSSVESHLIIECTVKVEDKSASSLLKDWSARIVDKVNSFIADIEVAEFNVIQLAWPRVLESLQKIDIDNPDDVSMFVEQHKCIITLAGLKITVEQLKKTVQDIIATVESEIELEKKRIRETKDLKAYEITLLRALHFKQDMEKMCPGLQLDLDRSKQVAIFVGQANDVQKAVIQMYEKLHNFVSSSMQMSKAAKNLLSVKETCKYIKQKMVAEKIIGVWDVARPEAVTLYGQDEREVRNAIQLVKDCIIEKDIQLDDAMAKTVQGKECSQLLKKILDKYIGLVAIETSKTNIMVVGVDNIVQGVIDEIKDYLDKHSVQEIFLKSDSMMVKFIQRYKMEDITALEKRFESLYAKLTIIDYKDQKGIKINGTKDGCKEVKTALAEIAKTIMIKEHVMTNTVGLINFFQGSKGRDQLSSIESNCKCFIEMKDSFTPSNQQLEGASGGYSSGSEDDDWQPPSDSGGANVDIGKIKVSVVKGELAKQVVDVIVNSTNKKLELNTGLISKTILKHGGDNIQRECLQQYPNGVNPGQVVVTSGGQLSCMNVYHGCLSAYDGEQGNSIELMKTFVLNCLKQADQSGLKSMAFPALGTGNLQFPADEVGKLMVRCIESFGKKTPNTSLKDISLVVYPSDLKIFQAFTVVLGGTTVSFASTLRSVPSSSVVSIVAKTPVVAKSLKGRRKSSSLVFNITVDSELNFQAAVRDLQSFIKNEFIVKEIASSRETVSNLLKKQVTDMMGMGQGNTMVLVNRKKGVIQVSGTYKDVLNTYDAIMTYLCKKEEAQHTMSDLSLPSSWTKMAPSENMKCVTLNPSDKEFMDVSRKFLDSAGGSGHQKGVYATSKISYSGIRQLTVIKIERVQNRSLYQNYKAKKKYMEQHRKGGVNKKELWHGTDGTNIANINSNGFKMSYRGSGCHDAGTCFAVDVSFTVSGYSGVQKLSRVNCYCHPDENGHRHIYLANVLTGESVVTKTPAIPVRRSTLQDLDYALDREYDSTTDNMANPQMFVIFHYTQAYPLYHITFR
ncbi:hypothetical protein CHS0354_015917 [Potamilus streckersoni]|uniref:Poly [ADP-ribose] polymerase n=1 Tax=Potamilus streckersoni TaxID=2493646 RepID=A0AAE0VTX8_9BIVA|nr:hypothetical protein CHS0354_015917 [Potamilus streckersoni]